MNFHIFYVQGIFCDFPTNTKCNLKDVKFPSTKSKLLLCFVLVWPLYGLKSLSSNPEVEALMLMDTISEFYTYISQNVKIT